MVDEDDELAAAIAELTTALRELRTELRSGTGDRRRRLRPPTPSEVLRLTDEIAIPALIGLLEANVRALETFQRGLRLVRREREVRDAATETTDRTRDRAAELRTTTLEQLDAVLAELQRASSEGSLPRDGAARDLIEEARDLRDDVDRRLRDATERSEEDASGVDGTTIPIDDGRAEGDDDDAEGESADEDDGPSRSSVDVDAELETLRDQYGPDDSGPDDADSDDGGSNDADSDGAESNADRDGDDRAGSDDGNASDANGASGDDESGDGRDSDDGR